MLEDITGHIGDAPIQIQSGTHGGALRYQSANPIVLSRPLETYLREAAATCVG